MRSRRVFAASLVLLAGMVAACGGPAAAEDHVEQQIKLLAAVQQLLAAGKEADARRIAEQARAGTQALRRDDPHRADALDLQKLIHRTKEEYQAALPLSEEVLRIRRAALPADALLYAIDLQDHAIIALGVGRQAEADQALRNAADAFRTAYGAGSQLLAQQLERMAAFTGSPDVFNRPHVAMEMLEEALQIRESIGSSPQRLGQVLEDLAMLEMKHGKPESADAHLRKAAEALERSIKTEPSKKQIDEMRGGLAQILIMRAGIAAREQRLADADALVTAAKSRMPPGEVNARELQLLVATIRHQILERQGDLEGAVQEARRMLDLAQRGSDRLLVADVTADLGFTLFAKGDIEEASRLLQRALQLKGGEGPGTALIMLRLADIEAQRGNAAGADQLYRRGLSLRKSSTSEVPILFGTNRARLEGPTVAFGGALAPSLTLGEALVLVPGGPGSEDAVVKTDDPAQLAVGAATSVDRLIALRPTPLEDREFSRLARVRTERAALYAASALVFVHGFGTRFEFAVARAGQIVRDLNYDGPAFLFTWPSQGNALSLSAYDLDQKNALASAESLAAFLGKVAAATGARKIHVIAHSMGNRVLLPALELASRRADLAGRIGEIVFASPDVDQGEFVKGVEAIGSLKATLYASSNDRALWVSWFKNLFSTRAGYIAKGILSSGQPVIVAGVDSIDVSDAGEDWFKFNHDVYASNPLVTEDLRKLLQTGKRPPHERSESALMRVEGAGGAVYWRYQRPR